MEDKSKVLIFLDEDERPIAEMYAPVNFELDTRKLVDGDHVLKIVGKDPSGKEGLRIVPFTVRNGPAIAIEGMKEHDVVDGIVPLMVNAYGKGDQRSFLISGIDTPQSVPSWVWILIIIFGGWALYYVIQNFAFPS